MAASNTGWLTNPASSGIKSKPTLPRNYCEGGHPGSPMQNACHYGFKNIQLQAGGPYPKRE